MLGESQGFLARKLEQFVIAKRLCDGKCRVAGLPGAEEFARTALLKVALGNLKSVGRGNHGFDSLAALASDFLAGDEDTVGLFLTATDSAAKLVKLGEAEAVGVLDDHDGGIRDIDADFDDGGSDENLDFVAAELLHDGVFFFGFEAAVEKADFGFREKFGGEAIVLGHRGFQFLLRFFDDGIDDVGLAAFRDFAPEKFPDAGEFGFVAP